MRLLLGALETVLLPFGLVVWMALKPEGAPRFVLLIPFGLLLAICFAKSEQMQTVFNKVDGSDARLSHGMRLLRRFATRTMAAPKFAVSGER